MIDTYALEHPRVVAAYLVRGKERALIDTGYASSTESMIKSLAKSGVEQNNLDYLLPTHIHLDHGGSCGALSKQFPRAVVRVHPIGEPHLVDPTRLIESVKGIFGDELVGKYGLPEPVDKERIRNIGDDEVINLGDRVRLRSVWTPGHASHHLSYVLEESGVMFTGDAVGVHFPDFPVLVPTTPPPSFNLEKAIASTNRILQLSPALLCTPHFGILDNVNGRLQENVRVLLDWKAAVESFIAGKLTVDEMAKEFTNKIREQIGSVPTDVPDYLRVLIRVNVLGFVKYLTGYK